MQNLKIQLKQKTTCQTKGSNPSKTHANIASIIIPFPERQRSKGTIPVQKCNEKAVQLQQVKVRKLNKPYWKKITKDAWILNIIEPGYKIEFFQQPFQTFFPKQIQFNAVESEMVSKEVKQLVDKGAIEEVKDISDAFFKYFPFTEKRW